MIPTKKRRESLVSVSDDWFIHKSDFNVPYVYLLGAKLGQKPVNVISLGLGSPDGLAVDWVTRKLYWTNAAEHRIELSDFDGTSHKVLFWDQIDSPRALCLLPQKG